MFSWTVAAQSMLREPLGVARAACFEQLAGVLCQLRCPALRKDLSQSEDKERYIPDTSELRSERLYFRIERLCGCISGTIIKIGFNGKSRMVCLSIVTAVYMGMTAWRPHKIPLKALLFSTCQFFSRWRTCKICIYLITNSL